MRIHFVFGKGIDGCGVTKGALLFEKWLHDAGHETATLDFDNDQAMLRAQDAQFIGPVTRIDRETVDVPQSVVDDVNKADIVIFHSYPTRKQWAYVERFRRFLERVDGPLLVMHDHGVSRQTINAIPQSGEIFSRADVLVVQSMNGLSANAFPKFDPGLKGRVLENPIWLDPHALDGYRKTYEERGAGDNPHLIYIGRMSPLKDPAMICRIEPKMPADWTFSLVGCEYSISGCTMLGNDISTTPSPYIPEFRKKIYNYSLTKTKGYVLRNTGALEGSGARIWAYDRYRYDWGMEQLGGSMASWCGYKLADPADYGNRMEYTVVESFLLSLPIINRDFADKAHSPEGKVWGDYYGPLISQCGEEEQLAEELVRVANDKDEWEARTEACREIIREFNDIASLAPKFLEQVVALGKRQSKPDPMDLIERWFPGARARRSNGEVIMSTPTAILGSTPMVLVQNKQEKVKI